MAHDFPSVRSPFQSSGLAIALSALALFAIVQLVLIGFGSRRQAVIEEPESTPAPATIVQEVTAPDSSDVRQLAEEVFPTPRRTFVKPSAVATVPPPPPRMHEIEAMPPRAADPTVETNEPKAQQVPAPLTHRDAVRMVELSKMAEVDQDLFGAIQYLRGANRAEPNHPEILYRLGVLYDRFGNKRESRVYFQAILAMGAEKCGELATLATHYMNGTNPTETKGGLLYRPLSVGSVGADVGTSADDGARQITLSMSIRSLPDEEIDLYQVVPHIWFYDLADGVELVQIAGEQPADQKHYRSETPDWKDPEEELLDIIYKAEPLDPTSGEKREFFGYVIKLYYKDEIQDVVAEPRVLLELLSRSEEGPDNSLLDSTLFDN